MTFDKLKQFRTSAYTILGNAKDALFDLMDAVLVTRSVYSFVELSVSPVFRRQWSSIYEALEDSNPPREELMRLYIKQLPPLEQIIKAWDHTAWPRLEARTLRERTYEHQAQPLSGAKPVTIGHGYSTIAWIPETQGSWALPLLHERITSFTNPSEKAASQLKQVCQNLPKRPLSLWDAEYGCASFVNQTADIAADKLMRSRSNRVLYGAPPPYTGIGRPRIHGNKFKLNDTTSWWNPNQILEVNEEKLGQCQVRLWHHLHFQKSDKHPMHLILVERRSSQANGTTKRPLWLVWVGEGIPQIDQIWHQYLRRFAVDHWYRFALATLTLDTTEVKYKRTVWAVEWSDATAHLATMVSPWDRHWSSPPLAKVDCQQNDTWKSCSVYLWSFSGDWYISSTS